MSDRGRRELARDLGGGRPYQSPGARKEKLRQRHYRPAGGERAALPSAELRCASAFSFLDGASLPEDLVARAAELDLSAVALVDRNGVPGAPRYWKAAKARSATSRSPAPTSGTTCRSGPGVRIWIAICRTRTSSRSRSRPSWTSWSGPKWRVARGCSLPTRRR